MFADDWMSPDWTASGWQQRVPLSVRAIWSELLPTHKWRLREWALSLEQAERDEKDSVNGS